MFNFNESVIFYLKNAEMIARNESVNIVDTKHLLFSLLKEENYVTDKLNKYGVNYKSLLKKEKKSVKVNYDFLFYSASFKRILDLAIINAKELKLDEVNIEVLFLSMLEEPESKSFKILKNANLDIKSLYKEIRENLTGDDSALNEIGVNLTTLESISTFDKVIGREKEVNRVIEILARKKKNNPLLVGKAGVGKSAIVEELARRINKGNVPNFLKEAKIISISVSSLVAGTKYRGEFEEKLDKIIKELEKDNNTILFIDEIHTIVGAGGAEGAIDASNILKPTLARGKIKLIGATTDNEYKKFIANDKALDRRFDLVLIEEPDMNKTKEILMQVKSDYEKYHNVIVPNPIIDKIVYFSSKYIKDKCEPDKSIDILDEVCASSFVSKDVCKTKDDKLEFLREEKKKCIKNKDFKTALEYKRKENDILKKHSKNIRNKVSIMDLKYVLESKTNTRIFELEKNDITSVIYHELAEYSYINSSALKDIAHAYELHVKKEKYNVPYVVRIKSKDISETENLVESLSSVTKSHYLKIDFNEYKSDMSISRFIGSPNGYVGYDDNNTVFESIKFYPNSIILLENLNSASSNIKNLIKSILESGSLTNSKGDKIYFNNSFIIIAEKSSKFNKIGFKQNGVNKEDLLDNFEGLINKNVEIFTSLESKKGKKCVTT